MTEAEMIRFKRAILAGGALIALLVVSSMAVAQSPDGTGTSAAEANILIQFRMGTLDGETRTVTKSYSLIVASGSAGSDLLAGHRIPFPTVDSGLSGGSGDDAAPARPIVYQNIGFVTHAVATIIDGGKIMLRADIENSLVVESEDGGLPVVQTRQVTFNAILTEGETLEVTRAEGVMDQAGFVEVEARILH
jgi:hypothetical protein